ncbi:MAG: hypothetical protein WC614_07940 [bacterium]
MKADKYVRLGKLTAIISFLLGTAILGLYCLTFSLVFPTIGCLFIDFVGLINVGILIALVIKATKDSDNKRKLYKTCGFMLLNIPVMLFYCWIGSVLLDTMRITFINSTQTELTDIKIIACEPKHIDKLKLGQSKTVWIHITCDCSINIEYILNGQRKEENLGYASSGMGCKMKYNIGGQNEEKL